jgi:hypothetical protein
MNVHLGGIKKSAEDSLRQSKLGKRVVKNKLIKQHNILFSYREENLFEKILTITPYAPSP